MWLMIIIVGRAGSSRAILWLGCNCVCICVEVSIKYVIKYKLSRGFFLSTDSQFKYCICHISLLQRFLNPLEVIQMFSSAQRSYQTQSSCDFISPDSCFFLIEQSAFPLFGSLTIVSNQTFDDSKSLFTHNRSLSLMKLHQKHVTSLSFWKMQDEVFSNIQSPSLKATVMQQYCTVPIL